MSDTIAALFVLAAAGLGVLSSVLGVLLKAEREKRQELARQVYENKRTAYERFTEVINRLTSQTAAKSQTTADGEKLIDELVANRKEIWNYGSPEVLRAYSEFFQLGGAHFDEGKNVAPILIARLILAMRIDMGLSNKGVDELDVLRTFLKDIDSPYKQAVKDTADYLKTLQRVS